MTKTKSSKPSVSFVKDMKRSYGFIYFFCLIFFALLAIYSIQFPRILSDYIGIASVLIGISSLMVGWVGYKHKMFVGFFGWFGTRLAINRFRIFSPDSVVQKGSRVLARGVYAKIWAIILLVIGPILILFGIIRLSTFFV